MRWDLAQVGISVCLGPFPDLSLLVSEKQVNTLCFPPARHCAESWRLKEKQKQSSPLRGSRTPGKCCIKTHKCHTVDANGNGGVTIRVSHRRD